jgi:hypothetical protein
VAEEREALEEGAAALVAFEELYKLLELHLTAHVQVCGGHHLIDL